MNPEHQKAENEPRGKGRSRVLIAGVISLVVVLETALFFFLVPSAEEISALAEARLIQSVRDSKEQTEAEKVENEKVDEFQLGEFAEVFTPIDSDQSLRVELRMYGLVRKKNVNQLKNEFNAKEGRLRHAIRMKIRNSELAELKENQLGLLQRRILTTCNHLLEGDLLLGVGFIDFQVIEQ